MYVGRDFSDMDEGEEENFTLDFASDLKGETITSTSWVISLVKQFSPNADPGFTAHLIGDPQVLGTRSIQKVAGLIAGNTYLLRANVVTSSSQHLSLWSHVNCVRPA